MNPRPFAALCLALGWILSFSVCQGEPIPRRLPPPSSYEVPADDRAALATKLHELTRALGPLRGHPLAADVEVYLKAVDLALKHGEFYREPEVGRAKELLEKHAASRLEQLRAGATPWTQQRGRVVRGFRSRIDDSVQPYGLVIPEDVDLKTPVPLYVWLHGRGDTQTDLHFITQRLTRDGQITPPGAIVLHPFGRHCLGFKSAGEIDVLEAIEHVQRHYPIDPDRIVLIGFSMGGAGAWHIGAHYTDRFVAISPGAGFAETARYTNLRREDYPPAYEQALWGVYDVPNYVRNLFNRTVIAYSGEIDRQIQAARIMEEAYEQHGRKLPHLIGPKTGHAYEKETLVRLLDQIAAAVREGRPKLPQRVSLQTRTLRYPRVDWVTALRLSRHWQDSRVDAEITGDRQLTVTTTNVAALRLSPWPTMAGTTIEIDGQKVQVPSGAPAGPVELARDSAWRLAQPGELDQGLAKRPGQQGPIDDVFLEPFLLVTPSGQSSQSAIQSWVDAELAHFQDRWRALFRGELRTKRDVDVTAEDVARYHLIAWGTPETNVVLKRAFASRPEQLPVRWTGAEISLTNQRWPAAQHVPAFIYPNPLQPAKYLVVNSGPTFREAHDRTNSLQNPKLPDWAIIDVTEPPSASAPGRVVAADFFDEKWQ